MTNEQRREHIRTGMPFNRFDIVFFSAVAAAIATVIILVIVLAPVGTSVSVTTPEGTTLYPLSENRRVEVDGHLTLVIEDGTARVENADCPDKVCEHTGRISRSGALIACLPNGIVITITGESDFVEVS